MIPFLYYVENSHYNTRLKKTWLFTKNTYIYTKNNKGYKLFDYFSVFYSYFFRFFPTFSDIFCYGPMEHFFLRLIIFSNQKSIKQFSRYELKKKVTFLVYILENDLLAPVHYTQSKLSLSKRTDNNNRNDKLDIENQPKIHSFIPFFLFQSINQ